MIKQVIVMRKDLNMRKGKMIAQGAHASMKAVLSNMQSPDVVAWLEGKFTKIVVSVDSEQELMNIYSHAKESGLIAETILDSGMTEFNGIPTLTCAAIGPADSENIDHITGNLKLL